jgi:DNA polymerase III sliding clamp (beta) subunit (PCNA family)
VEIQTTKLLELMALMKPVISKKTKLEIAKYIRVGEGKAIATDLETMVITDLSEAKEPMLLPFSDLSDVLKYIPSGKLQLEVDHKTLSLVWENGSATYPTMDAAEYPVLPEMETVGQGSLNGDLLIPAIESALPYAADDDTRPVLAGVTVILNNPVAVAAGDGFRMSHQPLNMSFPSEEIIILPRHSAYLLGYVFTKTPRTPPSDADNLISVVTAKKRVYVTLLKKDDSRKARFDFGSTSVVVNLVAGSSPDFVKLIPEGDPIMQSQVFAPQLEAMVNRAKAVAKDGSNAVRLEFADGKLNVSAYGGGREIKAAMDVLVTQGEPYRFGISYPYLLEFLKDKKGIISIAQYTDTGPVVFEYGSPQRILIMPMAIKWDEKPGMDDKTEDIKEEVEETKEPAENPAAQTPTDSLDGKAEATEEEPEEETAEPVGEEEPITQE